MLKFPKDVLDYIAKLVHNHLVQKLNREYKCLNVPSLSDNGVDTSSGVKFRTAQLGEKNFILYSRYDHFLFNYRHIYNGTVYQYTDMNGIYNIKDCRRVSALSKNYIYTPIYTN